MFGEMGTAKPKVPSDEHIKYIYPYPYGYEDYVVATATVLYYVKPNASNTKVRFIAGNPNHRGYRDGAGAQVYFDGISSISHKDGGVLVADRNNHVLRFVSVYNNVQIYAGKPKTSGNKDGGILDAKFNRPISVASKLGQENIYVVDSGNSVVRVISQTLKTVSRLPVVLESPKLVFLKLGVDTFLVIASQHQIVGYNLESFTKSYVLGSQYNNVTVTDGLLQTATFGDIKDLTYINDHLMIVVDHQVNRLRVVDLWSQRVSSICSNNEQYLDGVEYIDGNISACTLDAPATVARPQLVVGRLNNTAIAIGDRSNIRILSCK